MDPPTSDIILMDRLSSRAAPPLRLQHLEKMLDLTLFLRQLDGLLAQSIKITGAPCLSNLPERRLPSIFSEKSIWSSQREREETLDKFYNFSNLRERTWLRKVLIEESDSDSDGDFPFTEEDLKALLKVHRSRRKYQKEYHSNKLNKQYKYYGAGLISTYDPFPEHQDEVLKSHSNAVEDEMAKKC